MIKLGERLLKLSELVTTHYDHIWDCCCDHGLLGATLLNEHSESLIHFVDIVPELMSELDLKFKQFYPQAKWQNHCIDVNELPLSEYNQPLNNSVQQKQQTKHLVIIAGVGGNLTSEFVTNICNKHPDLAIDFLLCPVHHQYMLREQLISLNIKLKQEVLVEENNRFYELLLVTTNVVSDSKIDANTLRNLTDVGQAIWQTANQEQRTTANKYLAKTLQHYKRMQLGGRENVAEIIAKYEMITVS